MSKNTWQETLVGEQVDGTAVTGTAEASLLPGQSRFVMPGGHADYIGRKYRVRAAGRISNIITTPGTLTLRFKLGPTATIIAAASQAMQLNAVAKTNVTWVLDWAFSVRSVGSGTAATWMHTGVWQSESVVGSGTGAAGSTGPGQFMIPATAPAVGAGFDSTISNLIDLTAQFSLTGNSIQLHQFAFESMN